MGASLLHEGLCSVGGSGTTSWTVQQILSAKKTFSIEGMAESKVTLMPSYSIKKIYGLIREEWSNISWRRLVCNNKGVP